MTVALMGIDAVTVEVQAQIGRGLPSFSVVGLADKAVSEARERVRAALTALGLSLPPERLTINLSPADIPKEGNHYDLPIALALLVAMDVLPSDCLDRFIVMGELGLDASIRSCMGALPAAMTASAQGLGLICPAKNGGEAAFASDADIVAAHHLMALMNHLRGEELLKRPVPRIVESGATVPDIADVKGQETAKRALEIAAAGGHHLLMIGPPGAGKSMMAERLAGLLPPMSSRDILEASMIASISGNLDDGALSSRRPFRSPHHSASLPALIGGGSKAKPGEVSLAHGGILFLDELPEFNRQTLESLRQPLETGKAVIARAQAHVSYPARFQLVAAMNPCRCGYLGDENLSCNRAPGCGMDYQARISGPLYDRIDLTIDVQAVSALDLTLPPPTENSAVVRQRVLVARERQRRRFDGHGADLIQLNSEADGHLLEKIATLGDDARALLREATEKMRLSARGYHRVLKTARTIADLAEVENIQKPHIAEALAYRRTAPLRLT